MSHRADIIEGVKWTSVSSFSVALIQVLQISILTRILSPEHFGLMAIAMVVIGFCQAFVDMGISNIIIHKQNLDNDELISLFWINLVCGVVLTILISLFSPIISSFYRTEKLQLIILLVSFIFVFQSVGQLHFMLLQKNMRFNRIAQIEIMTKLIGFGVAIALAKMDFGVFSLIFSVLAATLFASVMYIISAVDDLKPKFIFNFPKIKAHFRFGFFQMGERAVNYFNSQFDIILIGRLLSPDSLGLYSIVKQLAMRPSDVINPIVTRVVLPIFAKIQYQNDELKRMYLILMNFVITLNFSIYSLVIIFANEISSVLFGAKWSGAPLILRILSVYAAIRSTGNPVGILIVSKGRASQAFYWNVSLLVLIPGFIWIGSFWDIKGISLAMTILMILLMIPSWKYLVQPNCGANFNEYFSKFTFPVTISIFITATGWCLVLFIKDKWLSIPLVVLYFIFTTSILHKTFNKELSLLINREIHNLIFKIKKRAGS